MRSPFFIILSLFAFLLTPVFSTPLNPAGITRRADTSFEEIAALMTPVEQSALDKERASNVKAAADNCHKGVYCGSAWGQNALLWCGNHQVFRYCKFSCYIDQGCIPFTFSEGLD